MDVMCYEVFAEEAAALRRHLPKTVEVAMTPDTVQKAASRQPPAPLISTRTQSLIPAAWSAGLSGILTRSSGYDHLERFLQQTDDKIPCGYLPRYCPRAVAEHAVMLQFCLLRQLKRQLAQFPAFNRDHLTGREALERTAAVIGVGHIGSEIARLCRGLGMRVLGVDKVKHSETVAYVDLDTAIAAADTLFCALPLTESTRGLLDYRRLAPMQNGALFINISRGEISPLEDLYRLLCEKKLGGLGLDVFEDEQTLGDSLRSGGAVSEQGKQLQALHLREDVYLTPHNAFNTEEAIERKARQSAEALLAFLETGRFPSPVPESSP